MTTENVSMPGAAAFLHAVARSVLEYRPPRTIPPEPGALFGSLLVHDMEDAYDLLETGEERKAFLAMAAMFSHSLNVPVVSDWVRSMLPDPKALD